MIFGNNISHNGTLNAKVLLLNQSYEPLTICNVRKAIILIFLGKAELVEDCDTKFLRSINKKFPWPSVIRLSSYRRIPFKEINITRKNVLKRDGHKCAYCGRGDLPLTIDHVIPKSKGGSDNWENLVAACLNCNNLKGNRTPSGANMPLKIKPYRPTHIMFIRNAVNRLDDSWKPYLFHA